MNRSDQIEITRLNIALSVMNQNVNGLMGELAEARQQIDELKAQIPKPTEEKKPDGP